MRWSYIIPRLVLAGLVWLGLTFLSDPLIRWGMIRSGESVAGARVDVGGIRSRWQRLQLEASNIAVANRWQPGTNLFAIESAEFDLDGAALLHKSFVVTSARVEGARFGTPRGDSGLLPGRTPGEPFTLPWPELTLPLPDDSGAWLETLVELGAGRLDPDQLESVRLARRLEAEWQQEFDELDAEIRRLEQEFRSLKARLEQAESNPFERLLAYRDGAERTRQLLIEAQELRTRVNTAILKARDDLRELDQARLTDVERLRRGVQSISLDPAEISEALVGREVIGRVEEIGLWISALQEVLGKAVVEPEPVRWRGIDVPFAVDDRRPAVLIQQLRAAGAIDIDGQLWPVRLNVKNLSSDPPLVGKPIEVDLSANGAQSMHLRGMIDLCQDPPLQYWQIRHATNSPLTWQRSEKHGELTVQLPALVWSGDFRWSEGRVQGELRIDRQPLRIGFRAAGDRGSWPSSLAEIVQEALADIEDVSVVATIEGELKRPQCRVETDLGRRLAQRLDGAVAVWMADRKEELIARTVELTDRQSHSLRVSLSERLSLASNSVLDQERLASGLLDRVAGGQVDLRSMLPR